MALSVCGLSGPARRAYDWLRQTQRADGSWPKRTEAGIVTDAGGREQPDRLRRGGHLARVPAHRGHRVPGRDVAGGAPGDRVRTPRHQVSTRNSPTRTELPRSRATTTMTSPEATVSPAAVSGHSGWPVNRTLDDQPWLSQQPTSGASFPWGSAAASRRISGVTVAGRTLRARAISFGDRPRARRSRTRFQQFIIGHSQ